MSEHLDPLNPYQAGPNPRLLEHGLRILERSHDDSKVRDALGRIRRVATDAASGLPVPCYVYRLDCGHLVSIWTAPLPESTRHLYCTEGACVSVSDHDGFEVQAGRDRLIVELVNPDGMA